LTEADRSTLVGQYLGETAVKTQAVLQQSLGGVLFIDEAYALIESDDPGRQDPYGRECVDTLLKFIEDHRENIVVIIAGYPDKMDELLTANPGFKSRFVQFFDFEDYSDDELKLILRKMTRDMQYTVSSEVADSVIKLVSPLRGTKEFGNAREIRNLLEGGRREQAFRVGSETATGTKEEVMMLTADDFSKAFTALHGELSIDKSSTPNLRLLK
jgi:stage V sporulation protein K